MGVVGAVLWVCSEGRGGVGGCGWGEGGEGGGGGGWRGWGGVGSVGGVGGDYRTLDSSAVPVEQPYLPQALSLMSAQELKYLLPLHSSLLSVGSGAGLTRSSCYPWIRGGMACSPRHGRPRWARMQRRRAS